MEAEAIPAPKAEATEAAPKAKVLGPIKAARLHFGKVKLAAQARREMFADIPAGTDFQSTLRPDFWSHHTQDIRPLDTIEMFCEDGTWEALCRVMSVGKAEVNLSKISYTEHGGSPEVVLSETYKLSWKGPVLKWCIVRTDDGKIIQDKLFPKGDAQSYLANYLKDA